MSTTILGLQLGYEGCFAAVRKNAFNRVVKKKTKFG